MAVILPRSHWMKASKNYNEKKYSAFFRVAGAFTLDVIARTGFGIAVNSQKDKDDEFFVNAKEAMSFDITNPLLLIASTFLNLIIFISFWCYYPGAI